MDSDEKVPLFVRQRKRQGRGKKLILTDTYTEREKSGTHELTVTHQFGPGAEFPQTIYVGTDDFSDDPPIPVTNAGFRYLIEVMEDMIRESEWMEKVVRTRKIRTI